MRSRGGCPAQISILISELASLAYYVSALVAHKLLSKMFALRSVSMTITTTGTQQMPGSKYIDIRILV